jgi:hypothetical protein
MKNTFLNSEGNSLEIPFSICFSKKSDLAIYYRKNQSDLELMADLKKLLAN